MPFSAASEFARSWRAAAGDREEAGRVLELVLALLDLRLHALAVVDQRLHRGHVEDGERRQRPDAGQDAPVARRVRCVPAPGRGPELAQVHRSTSAVSEKRSLSPLRVVGEVKVTFLKRFDFSSAAIRSEAEWAMPSSVSRPARRFIELR